MRTIDHEAADAAEVAGGSQTAGHDDEDPVGEPLDLFEDVAREQDRPSIGGHRPQEIHHRQALARVHAVERLVQDQGRRIMHERGGHLDPLPHPLRVAADRPFGGVAQLDHVDRAIGGRLGIGHPRQARRGDHELAAGEEAVHRLALGDEADAPVHLGVAPGRRPVQLHLAGGRSQEPGHHVEQGRLSGAVRTEQAGDAGRDLEGHVVDRHHVAVPARDAGQREHAHAVTRR